MIAAVYTYGHLLAIAFSITAAIAFSFAAATRAGTSADGWFGFSFVLNAALGAVEMAAVLAPSLLIARLYYVTGGLLYLMVAVTGERAFAADVLSQKGLRRFRACMWICTGVLVALTAATLSGLLDDGLRLQHWRGVTASTLQLHPLGAGAFFAFSLTNVIVTAPLLFSDGPRRRERRICAVGAVLAPFVTAHELAVSLGWSPLPPLGGWFAAGMGLQGAFLLVERARVATRAALFGRYRLERRLGAGGMGEVWLAVRTGDGALAGVEQRVALKRLRRELADDPRFARLFIDEARTVARLRHPGVVHLHDAGLDGDELYLAMEWVDGASLADLGRAHTPAPPVVVAEIGVQLAAALAYVHELKDDSGQPLGLIHRDLTPHNVLVDESGWARLTDFGIARSALRGEVTEPGLLRGKAAYLSREQLVGAAYDHRVDLYALGVVLFELAWGTRPFEGANDAQVIAAIIRRQRRPRRPGTLDGPDAQLAAIIEKAIADDPNERWASAAELAQALAPLRDEAKARALLARWVADERQARAARWQREDAATRSAARVRVGQQ